VAATYSPRTIARWKRAVDAVARPAPPASPAESALLVIDMQAYFSSICEPILDAVARATAACRPLDLPVLFTQHGHADPERDGGMLADWWGDLIVEHTPDHRLLEGLGRREGDPVVPKRRYSAFFGTGLEQALRERGIRDLAVAGVMTNLCVETTVREAFVRDMRVRVLMDATATASEEMQLASLVNMAFGFAHVQTVAEWIDSLGGR